MPTRHELLYICIAKINRNMKNISSYTTPHTLIKSMHPSGVTARWRGCIAFVGVIYFWLLWKTT